MVDADMHPDCIRAVAEMNKDIEHTKEGLDELRKDFSGYRQESRKERGIIHGKINKLSATMCQHTIDEAEMIQKGLTKIVLILLTILGTVGVAALTFVVQLLKAG